MYPFEDERKAGCHRLSGTLRRRLRAGKRTNLRTEIKEKNGIKIAVIGSGPAGLSFAGDMAKYGYDVTVFEALHEIGGVLKYGIPRVPSAQQDCGCRNREPCPNGCEVYQGLHHWQDIKRRTTGRRRFKGIFVASGAGLPNFMNIPGENSINILSSNEYLTRQPDGRRQRGL